jgi:hypothetical protein
MRATAMRIGAAAASGALLALAHCGLEDLSSSFAPGSDGGAGDATTDALADVATADAVSPADAGPPQTDSGVHLRYLPDGALECAVYEDHQLYCPTTIDGPLYATPAEVGIPIGTVPWRNGVFDCWLDSGVMHKGGTNTWYRTIGVDPSTHPIRGLTPAYYLTTPTALDEDPGDAGLAYCD